MDDIIQGMLMAQADLSARLFEDFDGGKLKDIHDLKERYKTISYLESSLFEYINVKVKEKNTKAIGIPRTDLT